MELSEEIEFLVEAHKKHQAGPLNKEDFIKEVGKMRKANTISKEAFDIAVKMYPPKDVIVKRAMDLLSRIGEEDEDEDMSSCGTTPPRFKSTRRTRSSSGSYTNGGCGSGSSRC